MSHSQACPTCLGIGWVCETHPDQPFQHSDCADPGMACPTGGAPGARLAAPPTVRARRIGRAGVTRARGLGRP
jgi:hypothetical protein